MRIQDNMERIMEKECAMCGKKFIPLKYRPSVQIYCSVKCRNAYKNKKYHDNRERIIKERKLKYQLNREKKNAERRELYKLHREELIVKRRQEYSVSRDKLNAQRRTKYLEQRDKIIERNKRSYFKNRKIRRFRNSWILQGHKSRGILFEDFTNWLENKWKQQQGKCAICHKQFAKEEDTKIDHSHTTGELRGLLCNACNLGLGRLKEKKEIISEAINYIKTRNL